MKIFETMVLAVLFAFSFFVLASAFVFAVLFTYLKLVYG